MTYEQVVALAQEKIPGIIIMESAKDHVALQKAEGDTPFCITIPDASHLMVGKSADEILAAETKMMATSLDMYAKLA
jgi:hypothetical protein